MSIIIITQLTSEDIKQYFIISVVCKLEALVYDILPSTTAVFSYAIGFICAGVNFVGGYK